MRTEGLMDVRGGMFISQSRQYSSRAPVGKQRMQRVHYDALILNDAQSASEYMTKSWLWCTGFTEHIEV